MPPTGAQLWRDLSPELTVILRTLLRDFDEQESYGQAVEEMAEDARRRGHEIDAATKANVRVEARAAVRGFLAELDPDGAGADRALAVAHGRIQHDAGRTIEELLGFYTAGALIMWRRVVAHGLAVALTSEQLSAMATAVFAFIHDLSANAAEGYSQARSEASSNREARRERLLQILMAEPAAPAERIESAAQLAGYTIPERLAALAISAEHAELVRLRTGPTILSGRVDDAACLIIAADDSFEWQLQRALRSLPRGAGAGLGETVGWRDARSSFRSALAARKLRIAGAAKAGVVRAEDVPLWLLLTGDRRLTAQVRARCLAPLSGLDDPTREKLTATLRVWLDSPGQPQVAARRLGVHVQTVRYRLRQLEALLGNALEDPDARFELAVALRLDELLPD